MNEDELANRFRYHQPKTNTRAGLHDAVRDACGELSKVVNDLVPEGREKALAMTNLEQVMMWANAGIARTPDE